MANLSTRTSPRQARSAKSVDLILDAAERLFHDRGVAETSTVDVAASAQVSVGRLYYWFPDKESITGALMQRAEQRLRTALETLIVLSPDAPRGELLDRAVPMLGAFFREHPGSLAVLMRGPVQPVDHGRSMCHFLHSLAAAMLDSRVPEIPDDERDLVAATIARMVIGMIADSVRVGPEQGDDILIELRYVLAAYLNSRYPAIGDPVWETANPTLMPARPSKHVARSERVVAPALLRRR